MKTKQKSRERAVTLMRYVRTERGWTRRPVPLSGTRGWEDRLDWDANTYGKDVTALGTYQMCWYERRNGKSRPVYRTAGDPGTSYAEAVAVVEEKEAYFGLVSASKRMGVEPPLEATGQMPLGERLEPFLRRRRAKNKIHADGTLKAYRIAVGQFLSITGIGCADKVTADVLVDYLTAMEVKGLAEQTRFNKYTLVATFLRSEKSELSKLLCEYSPRVAAKEAVGYTDAEIEALLGYLNGIPRHRHLALATEMYYKTGLRGMELAYLTWDFVDLIDGNLWIKTSRTVWLKFMGKEREEEFHTKTRKDRRLPIPIEANLLVKLRQWRADHPTDQFVFPTWNGNPDKGLLKKIRRATCRAGMNCGVCAACRRPCRNCQYCRCRKCKNCRLNRERACLNPHRSEHGCTRVQCRKWRVHGLRHTFATTAIRNGMDVPMVQALLGHERLATTQRYVGVAMQDQTRAAINKAFGG
jgi:integrase